MKPNSLYDISNMHNTDLKNTGFDYKSEPIILKKTLSPYLYNNEVLWEFLDLIDSIVVNNIESIKHIRIHNNFTTDKDNKTIN